MKQIKENRKSLNKKSGLRATIWQYRYIYLMAIPVMLWYLIFAYLPMYGITFAFRKFAPGGGIKNFIVGGEWVGFGFFKQIMSDPLFWRAFKNTLVLSAMKLLLNFPVVIFLVLMLNEIRFKMFKKISQTIIYLPHFFSWVIMGTIMTQLLSINGGIIPNIAVALTGGDKPNLLTDPEHFRWVLVISSCIKNMGWDTIIYLSALAGIPYELYEAAAIDGASRARRIMSITLPCLLPTIITMLLIRISHMIGGDFDQVYNLYNSTVYEVADIIETYLYRIGLTSGKFSLATAMGLFKSVIGLGMLAGANTLSKKLTGNGIW